MPVEPFLLLTTEDQQFKYDDDDDDEDDVNKYIGHRYITLCLLFCFPLRFPQHMQRSDH